MSRGAALERPKSFARQGSSLDAQALQVLLEHSVFFTIMDDSICFPPVDFDGRHSSAIWNTLSLSNFGILDFLRSLKE
jgi:hypothetical protein